MCTGASIALLAGSSLEAGGQLAAGDAATQASRFNRNILFQQGKQALERGRFESGQIARRGEAVAGAQRAGFAAAGVDPTVGSALELQAQTGEITAEDMAQARHNALLEAWGYRTQATLERFNAKQERRASRFQAFGTLLGGAKDAGVFGD